MKDLTSPTTFEDEKIDLQKYNKRVILSSEWNDKLEEIQEWKDEQERLKNEGIQDLGDFQKYDKVTELSPEERRKQLEGNQKSQYGKRVDVVQKILGVGQETPTMGGFGGMSSSSGLNASKKKNSLNPILSGITFANHGRQLSTLEIENNKRILKTEDSSSSTGRPSFGGFGGFGGSNTQVKEEKADQDFRMKTESWHALLFAYQMSVIITVLMIPTSVLGVHILFSNPIVLLILSALTSGFLAFKLNTDYQDGPLNQNYFGNDQKIDEAIEEFKTNKPEKSENKKPQFGNGFGNFGGQRSFQGEFQDDDEEFEDDDDNIADEDYDDESETENYSDGDGNTSVQEVGKRKDFPDTDLNSNDKKSLFLGEEEFLQDVIKNRREYAKLHKPLDVLKIFAPIIVNYNSSFASFKTIDRNSWTFKNIAYVLAKTYLDVDSRFKTYNKHQEEYYFVIDEIVETALFYKIKIKLPTSITVDKFNKSLSKYTISMLKIAEDDVVDVGSEMTGDTGYIKFYKIVSSEAGSFLPLVSTGDVLRFNGMKTKFGKDILEQLNKPADFSFMVGLSNAEKAAVMDVGASQNTNIVVIGFTGSGKSASTGTWLLNAVTTHSPDEVGIIIVDPKDGSFWSNFKYLPHVLGFFGNKDLDKLPSIISVLRTVEAMRQDYIVNGVKMKNYYEARKLFSKREDWERLMTVPRLIIVLDEQKDTLEGLNSIGDIRKEENKGRPRKEAKFDALKDTYKGLLGSLSNVTREGGMTIMALSQRSDDRSIPRTYVGASSMTFLMKLAYASDADKFIGGSDVAPNFSDLPTGTGYLQANGMSLTKITTPLFSGNPEYLEELARIIGFAWTIIQSSKEDLTKEPQGYFLSKASNENKEKMISYGNKPFNLFNRDKIFEQTKRLLKEGEIHFDPDFVSSMRIDLDNLDDFSEERFTNSPKDITEDVEEDESIAIENDEGPAFSEDEDEPFIITPNRKKTNSHVNKIIEEKHEEEQKIIKPVTEQRPKQKLFSIADMIIEEDNQNKNTGEQENIADSNADSNDEDFNEEYSETKTKDEMTYEDVVGYFTDRNIKTVSLTELKKEFNSSTIDAAADRGLIYVVSHLNMVELA